MPASPAARATLAGVLAGGLVLAAVPAATADDDDLTVTVDGVSYHDRDRDRGDWDAVGYSIRSLEGWRYEWLQEPLPRGRSGNVRFTDAPATMPDGYCVVYVRVPGVGDWDEESGGSLCTTPPPSDPAPSSPAPTQQPTDDAEPDPEPEPEPEPETSAPVQPAPDPDPEPTAPATTAAPSPTPSPTAATATPSTSPAAASPTPTPEPSPSPSSAPAVVADGAAAEPTGNAEDAALRGEMWAAVGFALALAGIAVGGVVAWRGRRSA